jgi:hypothetical protein
MTESQSVNHAQLARLSIQSKIVAGLILIGFIVFCIVIGNNVLKISALESARVERSKTIMDLEKSIEALNKDIYTLRSSESDKIIPRASASPLPVETTQNGKRIFDYTVWIDLSGYTLKNVMMVSYPTIDNNSAFGARTTKEEKNGFSITFRGTKCVPEIQIDVTFSDDSREALVFNMCEALN